jgi:F-type H+-transporting ATPase subunit b
MHTANIILAGFHYILLFLSPEKTPEDTLLSVEPGLMIWTIVIFTLLVLILRKFAWKPLLDSLNKREQTIKDSVEKAEHLRQEAEKILEENKMLLAKADEESRRVINEGKQYAEKLRNELIGKTHEDAAKMIKQAKDEIEREKISALNELKSEIADLAVKAAGKIIEENLDEKKQKKIIDGFINQIPNN